MKYYLIYRPRFSNRYCLVSETLHTRTEWAQTPLDIFSKVIFTTKWKLLGSEYVEASFIDQNYQVIATFDQRPTYESIQQTHPEILL